MTSPGPASPVHAIDPWRSHASRIVAIANETPGVRTYELQLETAAYRFAPGQFNMLYLPGIGEAAISVSSDPAVTATISHTVRAVGNVTDALARLAVGGQVFLRGPFGTSWPVERGAGRDVVIVAGGLGLASQRAAILHLARPGRCRKLTVLHGAKRPDMLLYTKEYNAWLRAGVVIRTIVDEAEPEWHGPRGLVTTLVSDAIRDPAATTLLCCGPDPMMVGVAEAAIAAGVPAAEIFLSLERNMACAVAHCGLCQLGPMFVCRDGPVLPYDRIAPLLKVPQL